MPRKPARTSDVFKRTFYQMMLKFQIGGRGSCAGCVLAIPASVWDSWQRHLGGPELTALGGNAFALQTPGRPKPSDPASAWIYVFDIDPASSKSPSPVVLRKTIATSADAIAHYALKVAPEAALSSGAAGDRLLATIRNRLSQWWPELRAE